MNSAIIVAAGRGTRMGPGVDKLFLEVSGRPVVAHTWQCFDTAECVDEIVLVVREGMQGAFEELAKRFHFRKRFHLVPGGRERQDSVWNGLEAIDASAEVVCVQDGARPCTSAALIAATIKTAREVGAVVAGQRVTDTIKAVDAQGMIVEHLDRSRLWAVQTPQTFRVDVLRRALLAVRQQGLSVTDDTAACAYIGQAVRLVESQEANPKVTSPGDLAYVELMLARRAGAST